MFMSGLKQLEANSHSRGLMTSWKCPWSYNGYINEEAEGYVDSTHQ
jgi:hypothetical protein